MADQQILQVVFKSFRQPGRDRDRMEPKVTADRPCGSLSGFLIMTGGEFVGVLEGPPDDVIDHLERVSDDCGRQGVVVLREAYVPSSRFVGWNVHDVSVMAAADCHPGLAGAGDRFAQQLSRGLQATA